MRNLKTAIQESLLCESVDESQVSNIADMLCNISSSDRKKVEKLIASDPIIKGICTEGADIDVGEMFMSSLVDSMTDYEDWYENNEEEYEEIAEKARNDKDIVKMLAKEIIYGLIDNYMCDEYPEWCEDSGIAAMKASVVASTAEIFIKVLKIK